MKKAIFAGFAVLLALAMITCDLFPPVSNKDGGGDKPDVVYKDGKPWGVNLTINTGSTNRAMTDAIAKGWVNYYEVAFMYGTTIYRAKWRLGEVGRIAVPFGDYTSVDPDDVAPGIGAAILLAGRYDSKTLLAVGNLTTSAPGGTPDIDANTTSVTFTLTALTTDVKAEIDSTFQITTLGYETTNFVPTSGSWTSAGTATGANTATTITVSSSAGLAGKEISFASDGLSELHDVLTAPDSTTITISPGLGSAKTNATFYIYTPGASTFPTVTCKVDGVPEQIPMFVVKADTSATINDATYAITNGASTPIFPHDQGVFIKDAKLYTDNVSVQDSSIGSFKLDSATISDSVVPPDGIFTFALEVPADASGLSWLALDITVKAMDLSDPSGEEWHIKGGFKNPDFDLGADRESYGGAILLGTESINQLADIVILTIP